MAANPIPEAVRALVAKWRDSARSAKRYSTTVYEDGYAAAENACAVELEAALTAAQQQGQAVDGCPHCGGTRGHWEGCRAPVAPQPMQQGGGEISRFNPSDADRYRCFNCGLRIADHVPDEDGLRCKREAVRQFREVSAPPSAPVGVPNRDYCACMEETCPKCYAQQPAAVDGAKVSAALSRLARNEYGDPRTAAANRSRDIRAVRDALATQHQEPKP